MRSMTSASSASFNRRLRILALSLLCLVSLFNYLDRYMVSILLPAIKADLKLSDTELGFVSGTAFTILYAVLGIPAGRLADRYSRRTIIACALALWSGATLACGVAYGFIQLSLYRVAMGIGEAGATPPAHSIISDLFSVRHRATALSIFSMGLPVGIFIGFIAGGQIAQHIGWRWALYGFGFSGLILSAVVFFVLPEPSRGTATDVQVGRRAPFALRRAISNLARQRSFVNVCLGSAFYTLVWQSLIAWLPSYFTRHFGLSIGEVGFKLALVLGGSQFVGLLTGGLVGDFMARRDSCWYMRICCAGSLLPLPFYAIALITDQPGTALAALFPAFMFGLLQGAPALAVVQGTAGPRMRGVAVALYLLVVNLIGGLGSQLIGLLSDRLASSLRSEALGVAMLSVAVVSSIWSAFHFWRGVRFVQTDFSAALSDTVV